MCTFIHTHTHIGYSHHAHAVDFTFKDSVPIQFRVQEITVTASLLVVQSLAQLQINCAVKSSDEKSFKCGSHSKK